MFVDNRVGIELELFAALDHGSGKVFDLVVVESVDVDGGDERGRLPRREDIVCDIVDYRVELVFRELSVVHLLSDVFQRYRAVCAANREFFSVGGIELRSQCPTESDIPFSDIVVRDLNEYGGCLAAFFIANIDSAAGFQADFTGILIVQDCPVYVGIYLLYCKFDHISPRS